MTTLTISRPGRWAVGPVTALAVLVAAGCHRRPGQGHAAEIAVAAASDLAFAFPELAAAFERETGTRVTFSFGSTGQLARQIAEGAPYDVFAAASVSYVDQVVHEQACDGDTETAYARGRIALWSRRGDVAPPAALADLADPRYRTIAIANPEHAPYGKAAREALQRAGVWDTIGPRLVYGENVQQTLQFAASGNAEVAVVALSLAVAAPDGVYVAVDPATHGPLEQALVVCRRGKNRGAALAFARYVGSPTGRAIMRRYGFLLPGEELARR
jgi:molybdate transport system substrate-binding protein